MTKDEALKRFQQVKQRKQESLAKLEKSMKESYEEKTGKTANYFFAL